MSTFAKVCIAICVSGMAFMCLAVGGCVLIGIASSGSDDAAPPVENIVDALQPVIEDAELEIVPPVVLPRWKYENKTDALTDEPIQFASLESTNTVDLSFPYAGEQRGRLFIKTTPQETSVGFNIQRGQLFPGVHVSRRTVTNIRVDDRQIESLVRGNSGMQTELIFLMHEELPELIRTGKELRIEVDIYNESRKVFVFDLTSGR